MNGLSFKLVYHLQVDIRDGPFDIQRGAGIFLKKIVRFPKEAKKIKRLQRS